MINQINSVQDVEQFAKLLIEEGVSFHPDDDFNDYVTVGTNEPVYTPQEAALRNNLMEQCFDVCRKEGFDIYEVMHKIMLSELDKLKTQSSV